MSAQAGYGCEEPFLANAAHFAPESTRNHVKCNTQALLRLSYTEFQGPPSGCISHAVSCMTA